jgi:hypothetical protein
MKALHEVSPRLVARIAGALYLVSIIFGVGALVLNSRHMQSQGDKANLVAGILYTGLTLLLWYIFLPVSRWLSTLAAVASLAGCWLPQSFFAFVHFGNFVFFGLYCLFIGWLMVLSRFIPKTIGICMACAGVCWFIVSWPSLAHALSPFPLLMGLAGEGTVMIYLLTRGLDDQQWQARAQNV